MSVADKVCLKHTDREAAFLCLSCRKPVCDECTIALEGSHFCSTKCAEGHARTNANMEVYRGQQKGGFISLIIKLAIIGAIIYFGWQYKEQIMNMVNKT